LKCDERTKPLDAIFRSPETPRAGTLDEWQAVGTSNAEELTFERIDSGYIVAVATGEGMGRSATAQLLHASEVGFWPDLPLQMASLMQTVPDIDGTEVIFWNRPRMAGMTSTRCGARLKRASQVARSWLSPQGRR